MRRPRRWLSFGAAAAALSAAGTAAALAVAPGAGAAAPASTSITPSLVPAAAVPSTTASTSQAVAGYHVNDASGITSLVGTVTVPTVSCPGNKYSSDLTVQLVGASKAKGISGGTFIRFTCQTGTAMYTGFTGWAGFANGTKPFAVAPGNTIRTQLTITHTKGSTTATATVINESTGTVTQKTVTKNKVLHATSAWEAFQHVGGAPVTPFGTVSWSGAMANGSTFAVAGAKRYNMVDTKGHVLVSSSVLSGTGSSFTNKFHAST